jgi:transposase
MSKEKNKSFWDEIQEKYEFENIQYTPAWYLNAGMNISLNLVNKDVRPFCPICRQAPNIHDYQNKTLTFGTINGVPLVFNMKHSRYLCKYCGITFMDDFEHLPGFRSMTQDAENYIISKLSSQTFTEIANELGVCVQTIANRAQEFGGSEREIQLNKRYTYLSMDEVFISRNSEGGAMYYWLLNDNSLSWKSNNIRVDKGRRQEDVIKRLQELKYPGQVAAVSIDMWKPYRDAILQVMPQAAIVIDRFHVVKIAQAGLDAVRKKSKVPKELKADFKKDAGLFLSSIFKLSDAELIRLESYLKADAALENAYFITQELMEFYNLRDYEYALEYLASWETDVLRSGINEMENVLSTVVNWLPYIMNYFIHRITSGRTEGRNNLLRTIDRMGFHYGLASLQACLYAHDRKQEYLRWKKHQRKRENQELALAS